MPSTKTPTHCRIIRDLQFRGHAVYGVRVVSTSHSQIVRYLEWGAHFRHIFPCFLQFMFRSICF